MIIQGSMPAYTIIYDKNGQAKIFLGKMFKNTIKFSENGKYFILAGLGNLNTEVEIWENSSLKKISTVQNNFIS